MAAFLVGLSLTASAAPAGAAVTIGQLAPVTPPALCTTLVADRLQPTVTSGNAYVVPSTVASGTITSWSHRAAAGAGQTLTMKIYRPIGGATHIVVGHDGPRDLSGGALNTFPTGIPVKAGDVLGLNQGGSVDTGCAIQVPGDSNLILFGNLADGQQGDFSSLSTNRRLNITAAVTPSNAFSIGGIKRNKKRGTATLTVNVPNPGELTGSGKGVKVAGAAVTSKSVSAPGTVKLTIKSTGKKKRALNETGKVQLKPSLTYTPTGGEPTTQSRKLKLKKR
jgi:hypothetical protein